MKRRELLASALALPFLAMAPVAIARSPKHVRVTFPLIFQEGDCRTYLKDGRLHTIIGDKFKMAVEAVLKANPQLSPDLSQQVRFYLRQADGSPWGRPGPTTVIGSGVFKKDVPWTAPRNAVMAKSLNPQLKGESMGPSIDQLAQVVVKAHFHVS